MYQIKCAAAVERISLAHIKKKFTQVEETETQLYTLIDFARLILLSQIMMYKYIFVYVCETIYKIYEISSH